MSKAETLSRALLIGTLAFGSQASGSERAVRLPQQGTDLPTPTSIPILDGADPNKGPEGMSPVDRYKANLEEKYHIRLVGMEQGFDIMNRDYDQNDPHSTGPRPPLRWDFGRLKMVDRLMDLIPEVLREDVVFMLTDYEGTDCGCIGSAYPKTDVIGLDADSFNETDYKGSFSLEIHELAHKRDDRTDHVVWQDLRGLLADTRISIAETKSLAYEIFSTLKNEPDSWEPFANISQVYVLGHKVFMREMTKAIPEEKAQEIYEYYKGFFFDGREYAYGEADFPRFPNELAELNEKYEKVFIYGANTQLFPNAYYPISDRLIARIDRNLAVLPKSFYEHSDYLNLSIELGKSISWGSTLYIGTKFKGNFYDILASSMGVSEERYGEGRPLTLMLDALGGVEYLADPLGVIPQLADVRFRFKDLFDSYIQSTLARNLFNGKTNEVLGLAYRLYFAGEDRFMKLTAGVVGQEKATGMYEAVKSIFGGVEYTGERDKKGLPIVSIKE